MYNHRSVKMMHTVPECLPTGEDVSVARQNSSSILLFGNDAGKY